MASEVFRKTASFSAPISSPETSPEVGDLVDEMSSSPTSSSSSSSDEAAGLKKRKLSVPIPIQSASGELSGPPKTENIRENAHKYYYALKTLQEHYQNWLNDYKGWIDPSHASHEYFLRILSRDSRMDSEAFYLDQRAALRFPGVNYDSATSDQNNLCLSLYCALRTLYDPDIDITRRNHEFIMHLRAAINSIEYQQNKNNLHHALIGLVQILCLVKFSEVSLYHTAEGMINEAARVGQNELNDLNADNIGGKINDINRRLEDAPSKLKKSFFALSKQKFQGEQGINNDTGGKSNVPYPRSLQLVLEADGKLKKRIFCRFGTPTIQELFKPTIIDPMFEAALDKLENQGKTFVYFNHQRREGKENLRTAAIEALEEKYPGTFYCASIPLDGKIINYLDPKAGNFEALEQLIIESYAKSTNGCRLPPNISHDVVKATIDCVKSLYFNGVGPEKKTDREAFWGFFNTELKLAIIEQINPDYINSACKDNKDRGGTLSTIDEAVLNLKLGLRDDQEQLKAILYNALAPYLVKYEPILNNPNKASDHRLGYLITVLNHIASLDDSQVAAIQEDHRNCSTIVDQKFPAQYASEKISSPLSELPGELMAF